MTRLPRLQLLLALFLLASVQPALAQFRVEAVQADAPKQEFRGAWIATVINLDWPTSRTAGTEFQKIQLVTMLDKLKDAGINAVFFQVRSEGDAMYDSPFEPWSYYLTGQQGKAPEPYYDPLAFAIEEAHKRGMELHAWFNPYRSVRSVGQYPVDPSHVSETHPEWILQFGSGAGSLKVLNPGIPEVRTYIFDIIKDVVRRYDVDGIHFDDYFYPYPPNQIISEDIETYNTYGGSFGNISTWRLFNINMLVRGVHEAIEAEAPHVKFGISPFGIWKSGVPAGIGGLSAVDVIYADAVNWLDQEWIDYLVPQLYWAFGGGQDYGKLAPWWEEQMNGRHLYTGHGVYRSDASTCNCSAGTQFTAAEVPNQVRFNRDRAGIQGSVFFRARNITDFSSRGFADSLKANLFRYPAITPTMPWKDLTPAGTPQQLSFNWVTDTEVELSWQAPAEMEGEAETRRYAVYRIRSGTVPDFSSALAEGTNLLAVTGETMLTDAPGIATDSYYYVVTALSTNSVESAPSDYIVLDGRAVAAETEPALAFRLEQNYPNPFSGTTDVRYSLDKPARVSLRVFDVMGREVAVLVEGASGTPGAYVATWDGTDRQGRQVVSGLYFYVLDVEGRRITKAMVRVR